ncbi:MAG: DUF362 domain-containing protein [Desulfomonilaceae bacterium]
MVDETASRAENVVWIDARSMTFENNINTRLQTVLDTCKIDERLTKGMRVSLKINTPEQGYPYSLRPFFIRIMAERANFVTGERPVVCDGIKLVDYWRHARGNEFLQIAFNSGYSNETLGGHFVINGGFSGDEGNLYQIDVKDSVLGGVKVGTAICRSDFLWVISHVTLHPLIGLSGALLNGGFDCLVGSERTRVLRGLAPYPFNGAKNSVQDLRKFCRRALESHVGVRKSVNNRVFYVNFLWDSTPQPDYFPYSDSPFLPNIGFLGSYDPVALDTATHALIRQSMDSTSNPNHLILNQTGLEFADILMEAESLGLGSANYRIKHVS